MFEAQLLIHWAPIWLTSEVCSHSYIPDIVLQTENLDSEFKSLLGILGLTQSDFSFPQIVVKGTQRKSVDENKPSNPEDYKQYFSQLNKAQVYSLYEIYKMDFELFDYSVQKYLECSLD
ncbi:carbohydrate sulfotransferase 11 [Eurytemora carolleeae]|uniref:carbohydrate sulfotransferase 11 n=1 Tax=Eurytemora carolleeae TaxID=1294199 RepID=UPI000C791EB5|nr:carbohydrate sulfotransferase 11 [Eurytemora carolleeae]|eukprot:XP_023342098.1 carbohydrate sulfotransferase 11-like [Eurytemora affinis]